MPLYEYKCKTCGFDFELLIFSGETPECPQCKSKDLQKKISLCAAYGSEEENTSFSTNKCSGCVSKNCSSCK